MSVYAFNDNLEKVPIVIARLSLQKSCAAGEITTFEWNTQALTAAGITASDLPYCEIIGISWGLGSNPEYWYSNYDSVLTSVGVATGYPYAQIDTYLDKVVAGFYNNNSSAQAVTMRVTLMKVA